MRESTSRFSRFVRQLGEALAIVLSILLAFAIDAWWEDRAEYREETRLLTAWRSEVDAADSQYAQEFEHYFGVFMPLLRPRVNLAQISNASLTVPGDLFLQDSDIALAQPAERQDHRALFSDREFQNAVVEKAWIEQDILRHYHSLESRVEQLLKALDAELAGRAEL